MEWLHLDSRRRHLLLLVLVILPLYAINGRWGPEGNLDTLAVGLAADQVTETGSLDLSSYEVIVDNLAELDRWFVPTPKGQIVSNRAPGLIALAIPSYFLFDLQRFSNGPATAIALLATMLPLVVVWNLLIDLVGLRAATFSTIVLGPGTTTWPVSSAELWPHGPGQLWAAIGLVGLCSGSAGRYRLAYAASITTRPLTAVTAFLAGTIEGWRRRSWAFMIKVGGISAAGVVAVLLYNRWVFGDFSIRGGYSESLTTGALDRFALGDYMSNLFEMFIGLPNGALVTTPIIGLALAGAIAARKHLPGWTVTAALSGLGYLLVHAVLNRASAGAVLFYRHPLEAIVLATPMLAIGGMRLWNRGGWSRRLVVAAVAASIVGSLSRSSISAVTRTSPSPRPASFPEAPSTNDSPRLACLSERREKS